MTTPEFPDERGPEPRDYWNDPDQFTEWALGCGVVLITVFFALIIFTTIF